MKKVYLSLALCLSSSSFAALPGFFQSKREILAILNHEKIKNQFAGKKIHQIKQTKKGYKLSSFNCQLETRLIRKTKPVPRLGPSNFELAVEKCKSIPDKYDPEKEITYVLNNSEVSEKFGSFRRVKEIKRSSGGFILKSDRCRLEVKLSYQRSSSPSSSPFEIKTKKLKCKK